MAKTKDEEIQELRNENVRLVTQIEELRLENDRVKNEAGMQAQKARWWERRYRRLRSHITNTYKEAFSEREKI